MDAIQEFKSELDYVDAIGVYSMFDKSFLYKDDHFIELPSFQNMLINDCFKASDFLYLQFEINWIFMLKHEGLIMIFKLTSEESVNRAMLEIKALDLIKQF